MEHIRIKNNNMTNARDKLIDSIAVIENNIPS